MDTTTMPAPPAAAPVMAEPDAQMKAVLDQLTSMGGEKLRGAGVTTGQRTFPGVAHEFFGMAAAVDKALAAEQMAGDALKKAFGG